MPQISDTDAFAGNPLPLSTARVCTGPCAGVMLRPAPATLDLGRRHLLRLIRLDVSAGRRRARRHAKHEPGLGRYAFGACS